MLSQTERTGAEALIEQSSVSFSSVPTDQVEIVWPFIEPMIRRGLARGQGDDTTIEDMRDDIESRRSYLWVVHRGEEIIAGVVLSIRVRPKCKKLMVDMLAGREMDTWADDLQALLIRFKNALGADCIEASCRPGLAEFLKKKNWNKKAIIMELTE